MVLELLPRVFFNVPIGLTIVVVGIVVVIMSVIGGSWAIIASDFMQTVLLMSITLVAGYLALSHPAVGGISRFIEKIPESHIKFWRAEDAVVPFRRSGSTSNSPKSSLFYLHLRRHRRCRPPRNCSQ